LPFFFFFFFVPRPIARLSGRLAELCRFFFFFFPPAWTLAWTHGTHAGRRMSHIGRTLTLELILNMGAGVTRSRVVLPSFLLSFATNTQLIPSQVHSFSDHLGSLLELRLHSHPCLFLILALEPNTSQSTAQQSCSLSKDDKDEPAWTGAHSGWQCAAASGRAAAADYDCCLWTAVL
jgi:hypothetical protein